jgi:molecular chaperone GrpE
MHSYSEGVEGPTCEAVLQPGYRIGERILRPARVAVVEASEPAPEPEPPAEPEQAALPEPPEQPA